MQETDSLALYELARKIANQKAGRRYYRNHVISEAYLAVVEGDTTERGIENAVTPGLSTALGRHVRGA